MTATTIDNAGAQVDAVLSATELTELRRYEEIIKEGRQAFVEVGNALADIRDKRLYRANYKTFELYCRYEHGFSKTTANRWIIAAAMMDEMQVEGVLVENENQARNLANLSEEARQEAIEEAKSRAAEPDKPVSARDVLNVAQELHPQPAASTADHDPADVPDWFPESLLDHTNERLSALQDNLADIKFSLNQKAQQPGVNAQIYQGQIESLELGLSRIDAEWTRRNALLPSIPPAAESPAEDTGEPDAEGTDDETTVDEEPQAEGEADNVPDNTADTLSADVVPAPVAPVSPASVTAAAQDIVTTLDQAAKASAPVAVVDKRQERVGDPGKATPVPAPPASAPAASASPALAAPAPPAGGMVMAMIPRGEQDYLNAEGLTAATAIALLRGLRAEPALPAVGYVLSTRAQKALAGLTARANRGGANLSEQDQLESILIARFKLIEDEEWDDAETNSTAP